MTGRPSNFIIDLELDSFTQGPGYFTRTTHPDVVLISRGTEGIIIRRRYGAASYETTKSDLEYLHHGLGASIKEIADLFGVDTPIISDRMNSYGIEIHPINQLLPLPDEQSTLPEDLDNSSERREAPTS